MSHSTPAVDPPFQQMADLFRHIARRMPDPNEINFEKMRKMRGVEFEGTIDPTDVEQWLECMERVFEQLECSDATKFKHVVSLLQKDAYDWWVSVPNAKEKPPVLTRNDFVKEFHMKGSSKRGRFDNSKAVSVHKSARHKQNRSNFSTASTPSYGQGKTRVPTCAQYGKNHSGTCRRASGAFFNCGSFDHKVKDCPNPNLISSPRTEGSVQKPITSPSQGNRGARSRNMQATSADGANQASRSRDTAQAYAMRQRDDQDKADGVVGFPKNVKSVRLDCGVFVQSPLGQHVICNQIYRDCPLVIQNLVLPANFIEMPFQDYGVIVGMDWPYRYHVVVDCRSKHVTFRAPSFSHIIVQGERSLTSNIISVVVARKMVSKGYEAYLAHIFDTHMESPGLKDIPVVCEFP
ncbi:uncharacterized protein LOC132630762 [Lycium barbarum]|uniref:uncharacterized protein LOC132630762 n=1 Tax=Lycium barbarum TaxID=112863 RepID=UPI00293F436F|nr:uncharacterized protein LOC132630762 [Lycium barbarum]